MVESTIDKIKDITVERQIRKLAGVIDEQNDIIGNYGDLTIDIQNLKESDANQTTQINNLKQTVATDKLATESAITELQSKDAEQDGTLTNHATLIQGITESLVSDVKIMSGATTGDIKIRLEREKAAVIDSNNYNLGLPVSAEIIQGTGPSMFKVQITMSSGVKVVSNDFVFTTEAIGNDVYISSFTFKAGNQDGYLSADIGLNNGVTIEANNFLVPTDPNVISSITDLQTRTEALEQNVIDINNKADLNNVNQTIVAKQIDLESIVRIESQSESAKFGLIAGRPTNPFTVTQETEAFGQIVDKPIGSIAMLDINGAPMNFTAGGGGEVWEEVDLSNWPTDWVNGDIVRVVLKISYDGSSTNYPATTDIMLFLSDSDINPLYIPIAMWGPSSWACIYRTYKAEFWNNKGSNVNNELFEIRVSGGSSSVFVNLQNYTNYIYKMWRLKK